MSKTVVCRAKNPKTCRKHGIPVNLKESSGPTTFADYEKSVTSNFVDDVKYRNIKKMPALFVVDWENHTVTKEINPKADWLFNEPAVPTFKRDGTSVTVREDGKIFARRMVKKGKQAPEGFILAEVDPNTGHSFGLEPIEQSGFYKFFKEAVADDVEPLKPGTYELCSPKINGNPEHLISSKLFSHGSDVSSEIPDMRTLNKNEVWSIMLPIFTKFKEQGIEGIVWWGANGKRAKLRVKDFFGDPNRR